MLLSNVDSTRRLWSVQDLLDPDQVDYITSIDWPNMPWTRGPGQISWPRRLIKIDHEEIKKISGFINSKLPDINQRLETNFVSCGGVWWLDEPGFSVATHTDGELPFVMQIYWISPFDSPNYGTCFYHHKDSKTIRFHFQSQVNSGYLLLNHPEGNGSQPLQWHGMHKTVPPNTWRLSSYWYFHL